MSRACLEANYDNHVGSSMFGFDMECSNSYQGDTNNIQLSPEGEVNSGGYTGRYTEMRSVEVYIQRSSPTLRGVVALAFTKSDGQKDASSISSSKTFAKRCAIFLSVRKTVNIQGYSKLREPIKTRKNCYPLIW